MFSLVKNWKIKRDGTAEASWSCVIGKPHALMKVEHRCMQDMQHLHSMWPTLSVVYGGGKWWVWKPLHTVVFSKASTW